MNFYLCNWCLCPKERNWSQVSGTRLITSLITSFDLKNYTKVNCAFCYWAEQNSNVLSQLTWVVFAVPMTQVSVERLFSGIKFVLSDLRNSLAEDTLQAIMLQRTNVWAYQLSWVYLAKIKNFKDKKEMIAIAKTPGHRKKLKAIESLPLDWWIKVYSKPNLHEIV